jgi:antitoxin component YwqK of YwqJK toxin-antitoxin module
MRFVLQLTLLTSVLLLSCNSRRIESSDFYAKNNIIYKTGSNIPFTGKVIGKTEGKVFTYEVKDGLKNGEFKIAFENGNTIMIGHIINDKNEGKWKYYFASGEMESEGNFTNNIPDSIWVWYYPDSKIKEKGLYVNGKRKGNWKTFDDSGKVIMENNF